MSVKKMQSIHSNSGRNTALRMNAYIIENIIITAAATTTIIIITV